MASKDSNNYIYYKATNSRSSKNPFKIACIPKNTVNSHHVQASHESIDSVTLLPKTLWNKLYSRHSSLLSNGIQRFKQLYVLSSPQS